MQNVGARYFNNRGNPYTQSAIEDAKNAQREAPFYRTNVITLKGNYWYGFEDNVWNNEKNWTMRYVPPTTPDAYAALTDKSEANVEFATKRIIMEFQCHSLIFGLMVLVV